jgi:hypothetical protein
MERHVFIDETGDLGEKGSKYFIITAIWTEDIAAFDRIIKNARRNKFRKELSKAQEIKANKSSKELIEYILERFAEIETAYAQSIILDKKKIYSDFLKRDKNKLYNFVCRQLSSIAPDIKELIIRIDKSKSKQSLIADFDQYLERKFRETKWNRTITIHHNYSQSWSGLQIADVISWAVFQRFEHNNNIFFNIIEDKTSLVQLFN